MLVIKLSHPNLQLESIAASPGSSFGKQVLGRGTYPTTVPTT